MQPRCARFEQRGAQLGGRLDPDPAHLVGIVAGAIEPVGRRRARSLYTQALLTQDRRAICSLVPSPRSQAATTRSLRSIE